MEDREFGDLLMRTREFVRGVGRVGELETERSGTLPKLVMTELHRLRTFGWSIPTEYGGLGLSTEQLALAFLELSQGKEGKYMQIEPTIYSDEDLKRIDDLYEAEQRRGNEPRYFEDVEVGEALPPMAKGPLLVTHIISYHAGGYGIREFGLFGSRLWHKNRKRLAPFYIKNEQGTLGRWRFLRLLSATPTNSLASCSTPSSGQANWITRLF